MKNAENIVADDVRQVVGNGINNTNNKEVNKMNNASTKKTNQRNAANVEFAKKVFEIVYKHYADVISKQDVLSFGFTDCEDGMMAECLHLRKLIMDKKITCENDLKKELDRLTSACRRGDNRNTKMAARLIACQRIYHDVRETA